ncbi:MAG: heavy metal-associated domain-containing protein [Pirellulaceae bacterium]
MRYMVYVVAILIAAGIVYIMGKPTQTAGIPSETAAASSSLPSSDTVSEETDSNAEVHRVALSVPGMHCAFGCYPTVKDALEQVDGVKEVELAKQKSETELDNKTVYVTYTNAFNLQSALTKLEEVGFDATKLESE